MCVQTVCPRRTEVVLFPHEWFYSHTLLAKATAGSFGEVPYLKRGRFLFVANLDFGVEEQ